MGDEIYVVASITMYPTYIRFSVRDAEKILYSGSNPLVSTNGDYDALLSNTVNGIITMYQIDEFIFSKG